MCRGWCEGGREERSGCPSSRLAIHLTATHHKTVIPLLLDSSIGSSPASTPPPARTRSPSTNQPGASLPASDSDSDLPRRRVVADPLLHERLCSSTVAVRCRILWTRPATYNLNPLSHLVLPLLLILILSLSCSSSVSATPPLISTS